MGTSGLELVDGLVNQDVDQIKRAGTTLAKVAIISSVAITVGDALGVVDFEVESLETEYDISDTDDSHMLPLLDQHENMIAVQSGEHSVSPYHVDDYERSDDTPVRGYDVATHIQSNPTHFVPENEYQAHVNQLVNNYIQQHPGQVQSLFENLQQSNLSYDDFIRQLSNYFLHK